VAVEAISATILSLARRQILRSGAESLSNLAPICTYIALAPYIGAEQAAAAANEEGGPQKLAKVSAIYPLKSQVLESLDKGPADAAEVEAAVGAPRESVSAVFAELAREGLIAVVEEGGPAGPRYGTSAHLFFDEVDWARMSLTEREEVSAKIGRTISAEIEAAIATGSFDARIDRHLARIALQLDEQGWAKLAAIYSRTLRATLKVQAESAERLKKSGERPIDARAMHLLFEAPPQ
jgi:hypothetical protein